MSIFVGKRGLYRSNGTYMKYPTRGIRGYSFGGGKISGTWQKLSRSSFRRRGQIHKRKLI